MYRKGASAQVACEMEGYHLDILGTSQSGSWEDETGLSRARPSSTMEIKCCMRNEL